MQQGPNGRSRWYGSAQTGLLCLFAIAVLFSPNHPVVPANKPLALAGGLLCAIGVAVMLTAIATIRKAVQVAPAPKAGASLVTSGIYKYFRHPIYSAIVLLVIGLFLRKPTLLVGGVGMVVILFLAIKVRFEETLLMTRYPDYAAYKSRTWGVIPWPKRVPKAGT